MKMVMNLPSSNKNIAMCLTTGRSGTNLLQELLSLAENTCSLHEPAPFFSDHVEEVRKNPQAAVNFVVNEKLPVIEKYPQTNYVETSHMFGKGFFEAFISQNIAFRLMILNRPPREVAKSMWRVGMIPGRTEKGLKTTYHPDQPDVLQILNWQKLSNYQLCYWYCLEVERRKPLYKDICAKHNFAVAEISLATLRDWESFKGFAGQLGLKIPETAREDFERITASKVNRKAKYFSKIPLIPLSIQEKRLWKKINNPQLMQQVNRRYGG